ncbi:MAG: ABC transporter ATP-binding protein [Thermoplasmata archaeon]|nr:MAG: ABC transporter ATP-binding protein [Thermoplasmata archaeon]
MINLRGIEKTYRMGEIEVPVLKGLNLEVLKGEIVVVFGPSGCGKTTLLNIIAGIDRPTKGTITIDGKDLSRLKDKDLTLYRRDVIGYIFQFYNLIPNLTALENVEVALELKGERDKGKAQKALEIVDMGDKLHRFPVQLSGGEQQRVAIARALVKDPLIVVGDEPTGNLDKKMTGEVLNIISETNKTLRSTFLLASHDANYESIATKMVRIVDGKAR